MVGGEQLGEESQGGKARQREVVRGAGSCLMGQELAQTAATSGGQGSSLHPNTGQAPFLLQVRSTGQACKGTRFLGVQPTEPGSLQILAVLTSS